MAWSMYEVEYRVDLKNLLQHSWMLQVSYSTLNPF